MENPYQSPGAEGKSVRRERIRLIWPFLIGLAIPLAIQLAVLQSTGTLPRFLWLGEQAMPLIVFFFAPLGLWFARAIDSFLKRQTPADLRFLWLVPLLVLPTTILMWGAVHQGPQPGDPPRLHAPPELPLHVLTGMLIAAPVLTIVAILANRGQRSIVASVALWALFTSCSCGIVAGMNITGHWI